MPKSEPAGNRETTRALTILELLVVLAIVSLLVAIIVPAVQMAREAARRADCANRLKQIALAVHAYSEVHGCLPPGAVLDSSDASHFVLILPQLGHSTLYNAFNFDVGVLKPANITLGRRALGIYTCPSVPSGGLNADIPGYAFRALTCYAGNLGSGSWQPPPYDGLFAHTYGLPPIRWADVTDGTSHTALLAEWLPEGTVADSEHSGRGWVFRVIPLPGDRDSFLASCLGMPPRKAAEGLGRLWTAGGGGDTHYTHSLTPNQRSCSGAPIPENAYTIGSFHGGGATVALADGQVRFVSDSVDADVWRALGSRGRADAVGETDF